jgi:hypothetical protein
LVSEFGQAKTGDEIRACADVILNDFDDVSVRSCVITLAERRIRDCSANPNAPRSPDPAPRRRFDTRESRLNAMAQTTIELRPRLGSRPLLERQVISEEPLHLD